MTKKKNFMKIAKKFGEEGQYGRGEQLTEAEYNYIMSLSDNLKNTEGERKASLITNFFSEFSEEKGMKLIRNQIVSRMVDKLLPLATVPSIMNVVNILGSDLWTITTDSFSSHVLQTTLCLALKLVQSDAAIEDYNDDGNLVDVPVTDEQKENFIAFLNKVSKYCLNNLLDFITDTYATHVIRTVLEVCSGIEGIATKQNHQQHRSPKYKGYKIPEKLQQLLPTFAERFQMVPDLPNIISSECGSAVYQCCLKVFSEHPDCKQACSFLSQHLLTNGLEALPEQQKHLSSVFECNATSRLLEGIVSCCGIDNLKKIYSKYFESNLPALVTHSIANFSVQKLLRAWTDGESFPPLSDGIKAVVPLVLESRNSGVLLAWAEACGRLQSQQGKVLVTLMECLDCHMPEERQVHIVPALVQMTPHSNLVPRGKVSLHGALLVQELLKFKKPIKIINSLLEMPTPELLFLLQDPRGSHITDALCNSNSVGEKSRVKVVSKLQDSVVALACSKHGSRSLESLWSVANPAARLAMGQKLSDSSNLLKRSEFGAIIYSKFNIRVFSKKDKEDWLQLEQRKAEKRKALASSWQAFDEGLAPKKKKQKFNAAED